MAKNCGVGTERIIRALISALKPRKPEFDPGIEEDMFKVADEFLGHLPGHMKILLPLGLYLLEYGALILGPSLKPFSWMSAEKKEKYLSSWVESKIALRRDLIKGFKAIALTGYYTHPMVLAHLGMDLDAHLRRVNVGSMDSPPSVACSEEAANYFTELDRKGEWGPAGGLPGSQHKYLSPKELVVKPSNKK